MKIKIIILLQITLLYMNSTARYYNPKIGRFITADSETPGGWAGLQGLNRYIYCRNNPVTRIDVNGHEDTNFNTIGLIVPYQCCYVEGNLANLEKNTKSKYIEFLNNALIFVLNYPPQGNSLMKWSGNKDVLKNKSLEIVLTTTNTMDAENAKLINLEDVTGMTTVHYNPKTKESYITVYFYGDNLNFDKIESAEAIKILSRTMSTAAHEIYGNVTRALEKKDSSKKMSYKERVNAEINAFQAGIDFINNFKKSDYFTGLPENVKRIWNAELKSVVSRDTWAKKIWQDEKARIEKEKK